jgi:hypothetical protein
MFNIGCGHHNSRADRDPVLELHVGEGQARDERGGVQPCQALDRPLHQGTATHAEHCHNASYYKETES